MWFRASDTCVCYMTLINFGVACARLSGAKYNEHRKGHRQSTEEGNNTGALITSSGNKHKVKVVSLQFGYIEGMVLK